jgi:hypothetical protein
MPRPRKLVDVATDPNDVFGEQIAAQQAAAEESRQSLHEAMTETNPGHDGHADHAHQTQHVTQPAQPVAGTTASPGEAEAYKPVWKDRFEEWVDTQAGVKLRLDRKNGLTTLAYRDQPPADVIELLDSRGFTFDEELGVFAKKVSDMRPVESRQEAQHLAYDTANIIRAEKGLERKTSYYISREEHTR